MIKQVLGVLLLVGGVGAGIVLVTQSQLMKQKAADNLICPAGTKGIVCDDCDGNRFCNQDESLTCEGWKFTNCRSHRCTIACAAGESCSNGTAPCDALVYANDVNNCGKPNMRCKTGFTCKMGECVAGVGDVNSDGSVNIVDIGVVVDNYNKVPIIDLKADINDNGSVDIVDAGIVIDNYEK